MKIKKAVFPVAGLGTRFLPATKAMAKEMLPIVDKPLIQYAVEEAFSAGIEQIIFVTAKGKKALINHFDRSFELELNLKNKKKHALLKEIKELVPKTGTIIYTRQNEPLGLGHAIWCTRDIVGNEPFAVLLADDLIKSDEPVLSQMVTKFNKLQSSMAAIMEVDKAKTDQYGILDAVPVEQDKDIVEVNAMIEKPAPDKAPSNLAIIGRYILTPEIFDYLGKNKKGAGGEIQLTDAMHSLLK
ncbi:MAG: UTP--glucose-1-phosphate uridylyltransferase GalU, partial [Desulfobacteraceae bacterium]|nr:UTP--glucose-1-phosphate uridylyltransferase GalU [Desulfobacteraceae bacterium]